MASINRSDTLPLFVRIKMTRCGSSRLLAPAASYAFPSNSISVTYHHCASILKPADFRIYAKFQSVEAISATAGKARDASNQSLHATAAHTRWTLAQLVDKRDDAKGRRRG
jgi:hypothetical protein